MTLEESLYSLSTSILMVLSVGFLVYALVSVLIYLIFGQRIGDGRPAELIESLTGQNYQLNTSGIGKLILRLVGAILIVAVVLTGAHYLFLAWLLEMFHRFVGG